jgi:SPP1 family predicted phage head-tail adaptor
MTYKFNPGDYRHKITFLRHLTGQDDYGDPIDKWVTFKSVWASKDPLLGNEFFAALTAGTKVEVKFNCRYFPGVTNAMRIRHGDETYEILSSIDVKSLHRELLCYCRMVDG